MSKINLAPYDAIWCQIGSHVFWFLLVFVLAQLARLSRDRKVREGRGEPKGRGSQRTQEGLKGVPRSELDDCYTVSKGPGGGAEW